MTLVGVVVCVSGCVLSVNVVVVGMGVVMVVGVMSVVVVGVVVCHGS